MQDSVGSVKWIQVYTIQVYSIVLIDWYVIRMMKTDFGTTIKTEV